MHQDDALRVARFDEPDEVVVARMGTEVELLPLALDVDRDPVQIDHALVHEAPSVRPFDLVPGQEYRTLRVLPDALEVPQDGTPVEHAAGRHDDLSVDGQLGVSGVP